MCISKLILIFEKLPITLSVLLEVYIIVAFIIGTIIIIFHILMEIFHVYYLINNYITKKKNGTASHSTEQKTRENNN